MEVPAVKQCTNEEDPQFGAVAVQSAPNRWGVMHPQHGGGWVSDADVQHWTDLEEVG